MKLVNYTYDVGTGRKVVKRPNTAYNAYNETAQERVARFQK